MIGEQMGDGEGGRFVRATSDGLTADASGLRGLFYSSDGEFVASSSPSVIAELCSSLRQTRKLGSYSFNWYPPPTCGFEGVSAALPGDMIRWDGSRVPSGLPSNLGAGQSLADRTDVVAACLVSNILDIAETGSEIWVPLTAGLDSRTVLAAALAAGLRPRTFTLSFDASSRNEASVAQRIARAVGLEHEVIERSSRTRRSLELPSRHQATNADQRQVRQGYYDRFSEDAVLLRGGCFEIGRRFFASVAGAHSWADVRDDPGLVAKGSRLGRRAREQFDAGMSEWVLLRETEQFSASWLDLFYLDQRLGGWLAGIEMTLDAIDARSIHPANDIRILSALTVPEARPQIGEAVQLEVIRRFDGRLLGDSINDLPPLSMLARLRSLGAVAAARILSEATSA